MNRDEALEDWYRAAVAETMRPCRQYHNTPKQPLPSPAQVDHHRERLRLDEQLRAA